MYLNGLESRVFVWQVKIKHCWTEFSLVVFCVFHLVKLKYGMGIVGVNAKLEDESLIRCFGCKISEIKCLSCNEILSSSVVADIQTIKKQFKP